MSKISRNDPCPCGSGLKYKRCCLTKKGPTGQQLHSAAVSPVRKALDWLAANYGSEVREAVYEDYMGDLTDEEKAKLNLLPPETRRLLDINIGEWTLTDAVLEIDYDEVPVHSLVLGQGGLLLTAEDRAQLVELASRHLSLYEVQDVKLDQGLWLKDMLRPDKPQFWVHERAATHSLVKWDTVGFRIIRQGPELELSGAGYPLERERALYCREVIMKFLKEEKCGPDDLRDDIVWIITGNWLASLVEERKMPTVVDTATGEPLMLTTDHYSVKDWKVLLDAFAAQPDIDGDSTEGWVWFEEIDGNMRRIKASLSVKGEDGLEVFCQTQKRADEFRARLEGFAGATVKYKIRSITDPRSKAHEKEALRKPKEIPAEIQAKVVSDFMTHHYENWADIKVPVLGNKTPRQAVKTKKGKQQVIDLLKYYEQCEARRAAEEGMKPFDFGFLWESVGLDKE